jgi:hypothetical protein
MERCPKKYEKQDYLEGQIWEEEIKNVLRRKGLGWNFTKFNNKFWEEPITYFPLI